MTTKNSAWRLDLSAILKDFARPQKKTVLAGLNLAILGSIDMQQMTADEAIAGFYHATNCLYVRRSIKDKAAEELDESRSPACRLVRGATTRKGAFGIEKRTSGNAIALL